MDKRTFTALEIGVLLNLWNLSTQEPGERIALTTDWRTTQGFPFDRSKPLLDNLSEWPADARTVFAIALAQQNVGRTRMFDPGQKKVDEIVQRAKDPSAWESTAPEIAAFGRSCSESYLQRQVRTILVAREYLGATPLGSETATPPVWYWHSDRHLETPLLQAEKPK